MNKKSFTKRALALALSLIMVLGIIPNMPLSAYAAAIEETVASDIVPAETEDTENEELPEESEGKLESNSLIRPSQILDESHLIDGEVLDLSNAYGDAQNKTIFVSGNVKIIGAGTDKEISNLTIHAASGANLTIENLYLSGSAGEDGAICSSDNFTLTLNGTNKISQGSSESAAIVANVNVVKGTGDTLIIEAKTTCVGGTAFNATDIKLETISTEPNLSLPSEVAPKTGTLKKCTIKSSTGRYDISNMTISNCTWTNYAPYKVLVKTSNVTDAGSNNDILLYLDGVEVRLEAPDKDAEQTMYGYGKALTAVPNKLKVKMSGSDGWYGVSLNVYSNMSDYTKADGNFMVCQWVDNESGDIPNNNYGVELKIKTADVSNAGTDANIYGALGYMGPDGILRTGEFVNLSDSIGGNAFEQGNYETVYFAQNTIPSDVSLENCNYIVLKSDMKNAAANWKVYSISMKIMHGGGRIPSTTITPNQWIADKDYQYVFTDANDHTQQYQISVKTGTKRNSGTDSNLSFQLVGTKGTTNWVTANAYISGNAFEKGDTDTFHLTFDKNVGEITGVNIRSDLSGASSAWYCNYVTVGEYLAASQTIGKQVEVSVYSWFDSDSSKEQHFSSATVNHLQASKPSDGSAGMQLEVILNQYYDDYTKLHIYRAETIDGEYVEVADLGKDEFTALDKDLVAGERYYYKIFESDADGNLTQVFQVYCVEAGKDIVEIVETKVEAETLDANDITEDLTASGFDTVAEIETTLKDALKKLNSNISDNNVAFYDLQLYYQDGDQWLPAKEEHFPKNGELFVSIPAPAGNTADLTYYGVHMFSKDAFGNEAGGLEVLTIESHTDGDGQLWIDFYVTGVSPVIIGWAETSKDENDTADPNDKPPATENTEKVKDVTTENVTPDDKTDLEKAKADLEKALEDNGGNYTDDEKKAIEDEIKRIDDALDVIGNVDEVEELIGKLPENITKNDEDAIKAADDAYNALTDYEKSLVDEDAKKALDDAKAALAELNKPADSTSPNTGDNSNIWLWVALLFVSSGGIITLTVYDRKRRTAR